MKLPTLFTKTPNYKRFAYTPRHFDPMEEERKEREERIRSELHLQQEKDEAKDVASDTQGYRTRIAGSFRTAKKTATVQRDPSANMIRLVILMVLSVGLIAFIEYGEVALYGVAAIFVPFYLYLKYRKFRR
jgi:Flp pilus assembly protein TadB